MFSSPPPPPWGSSSQPGHLFTGCFIKHLYHSYHLRRETTASDSRLFSEEGLSYQQTRLDDQVWNKLGIQNGRVGQGESLFVRVQTSGMRTVMVCVSQRLH